MDNSQILKDIAAELTAIRKDLDVLAEYLQTH